MTLVIVSLRKSVETSTIQVFMRMKPVIKAAQKDTLKAANLETNANSLKKESVPLAMILLWRVMKL